jgi:NADH-quinone oxidoreductase subunit M
VDGISLWLVLLTAFITVIVVIAGWEVITERVNQYMGAFLILSGLMIGVFARRTHAVLRVLRSHADPDVPDHRHLGRAEQDLRGLQVLPVHPAGLAADAGGADLPVQPVGRQFRPGHLAQAAAGRLAQTLLFFAFFAAFAVKVPMWPVHTWLPDVHVEAPTGRLGGAGGHHAQAGRLWFPALSRCPSLPDASHEWAWLMITLSLVAVIYVGLVAMVQQDMKKLVAYSSVAHMGFVTLGFFVFNDLGVSGAIVQMIAHGFVSAAMFLGIGVLYDRVHSREIADYGGVVNTMPKFAAFALLFTMANCGLPGTAGFVGEWMVILARSRPTSGSAWPRRRR